MEPCSCLLLLGRTDTDIGFGSTALNPSTRQHSDVRFAFTLWNPSTRQYRDLPDCTFQVPANDDIIDYRLFGSGLGYDDFIDDYKAFCIVYVMRKLQPKVEVQVWMYELKSNIWRSCNLPNLDSNINMLASWVPGIGYFTEEDCSLHWLWTFWGQTWKSKIMSCDLRKESFSTVLQPGNTKSTGKLHVLEGCLCVSYFYSHYLSDPLQYQAELYMRKKDGDDHFTWTKLLCVTEPNLPKDGSILWFELLNGLGYSKREDKIMLYICLGDMVSYDLKKKIFGKVETDKDHTWHAPFHCLESLVSLGGRA